MDNKRISSKSNGSKANLFLSEDCPSQICGRTVEPKGSWMLHSCGEGTETTDVPPPGFEGNLNTQGAKESCIPLIEWKCPPKVILKSDWHVVAGEHSRESGTQKDREMRELEAWYPRVSDIPPGPRYTLDSDECDWDDSKTPLIPVSPIEDEDPVSKESPHPPVPVCSQSANMVKNVMAMTSAPPNDPVESKPSCCHKSLGNFNGIPADVLADVLAAVSAACAAIMKLNEKGSMIDTDMLIKVISNACMIEIFSKGSGSTNIEIASVPSSNAECHISSLQKPPETDNNLHSIVPNLQPTANNCPPQEIIAPKITSSIPSLPSSSVPIESLTLPTPENQASLSNKLDYLLLLLRVLLSTLRNYGFHIASEPDKIVSKTPACEDSNVGKILSPSSSSLFMRSDSASPVELPTQSMEISDTKLPEMAPSAAVIQVNQSWHPEHNLVSGSFQSALPRADDLPVPPLSFSETPVVKDINYLKNLVKLHGFEEGKTEEKHIPQCMSRAPELPTVSGQQTRAIIPCKFFNSPVGCRMGSSCPFPHSQLGTLHAGSLPDAHSNKRMRLS